MNSSIYMYFPEIKQKAIQLRKEGYSYNYIVKHVPVTKSTLSEWLRDVPFTPNQHTIDTIGNARIASGNYKHGVKMQSLKDAELEAKEIISELSDRDIMMLGLGIYIGEGGKTEGITRIINSDPRIIKLTLKWWQTSFKISLNQIKIRLFLYPDSKEDECVKYWSANTGISKSNFHPSTIDRRTNKKESKHGKLPFGTAHVSVIGLGNKKHSSYLHRVIMALINRVL
jgi:hypothetical protein